MIGSGLLGFWLWSGWSAEGLVVAVGIECEVSEEFSGGGVDDADVVAVDELEDLGSGVFGADADVVHAAVDAEAELAEGIDLVVEDPVVGVGAAVGGWAGFGAGLVGGGRPLSLRTDAGYPC